MSRFGDNLMCTHSNEEIVRSFALYGVDYLLIGGLAISWHCESRQADDMDLLVNPTADNSSKVCSALTNLRQTKLAPGSFGRLGVQVQLKKHHYADILTPAHGGLSFDDIATSAVSGKLFQIPIRIAFIESLIELKLEVLSRDGTQQAKHLKDLALLRSLKIV